MKIFIRFTINTKINLVLSHFTVGEKKTLKK